MIAPRAERVRVPTRHPPAERLLAFAEGRASRTERIVLEAHLFHCDACTSAVTAARPPLDEPWREARGSAAPRDQPLPAFDRLWSRIESRRAVRWPPEAAVLPPNVLAELEPAERWSWTNLWPSRTRFTVLVREPAAGTELYLTYYGKNSAFPLHYHLEREDNVILAGGYKRGMAPPVELAEDQVLTGDWIEGEPGTRHSPWTDVEEECWCLSQVSLGGSRLETFHGKLQSWLDAWDARRERLR
ncbi:MAG: zf-HC2 domain-containing protein [bacterium]